MVGDIKHIVALLSRPTSGGTIFKEPELASLGTIMLDFGVCDSRDPSSLGLERGGVNSVCELVPSVGITVECLLRVGTRSKLFLALSVVEASDSPEVVSFRLTTTDPIDPTIVDPLNSW
jgi:hypothetical protein